MDGQAVRSPAVWCKRFAMAVSASLAYARAGLRAYPAVAVVFVAYAGLKIGLNLYGGARLISALASGLMGIGLMAVMALLLDSLAWVRHGAFTDKSVESTRWGDRRLGPIIIVLLVWAAWGLGIVDRLQTEGLMPGGPILDHVPGWRSVDAWLTRVGMTLAERMPLASAAAYDSLIRNLLFRIALPMGLLLVIGYGWHDFGLSCRGWAIVAPVVLLLGTAYAAQSRGLGGLAALVITFLYPGLTEEFLYRGVLQRSLSGWVHPAQAILISALLFALLHAPNYYYRLFDGDWALTVGNMADVALTGAFWGYGFRMSGGLLPWGLVHALSDLSGL